MKDNEPMPTFSKRVRFSNLTGTTVVEVDAIVDTGATFCRVSSDIAERLGLTPTGSRRLRLADEQIIEYRVANALVELVDQGEPVATNVVIGEAGAVVLLGALALDALGLGIDTEGRQLTPKVAELLFETEWPTLRGSQPFIHLT